MTAARPARTVREVLVAARWIVARPGGWCQGTLVRDARGASAVPGEKMDDVLGVLEEGCSVCAVGALASVVGDRVAWLGAVSLLCREIRELHGLRIAEWNDAPGRTQAEVVAAFDRAIARCEEE